jgi:hypothetical protein
MNASVNALAAMPNGDLVAGGAFSQAGGLTRKYVARWDGFSWSALNGGSVNLDVKALCSLGDGTLCVAGAFSGSCAIWTDTGAPWVTEHPAGRSTAVGQTVTVGASCASGYDFSSPVTFRWKRNGLEISNGPGGASFGGGTVSGAIGTLASADTTTTLMISGIQTSDAGQYTVAFTNACGTGTSNAAVVRFNTCIGDLNGDRKVDGADVGLLLGAWGTSQYDRDGDGVVNGQDLGLLLGSWGACPN